tara:strand:+ start:924 stop:1076 length:153 start_codon:yes stop_codon:yes gene_type:complete
LFFFFFFFGDKKATQVVVVFLCPFYLLNAKGVNRFFIITQKGTMYLHNVR